VAFVGAESLAIVGIPDTDLLIFGYGEEQVAFGIESARLSLGGHFIDIIFHRGVLK
jgi:hypothetical protein